MNLAGALAIGGLGTILVLFILIYSFKKHPPKEDFTEPIEKPRVEKPSYSIKEECKHPNQLTQVLESSGTCETTIEVCADCNEPLTEPITDCR